MHGVPSSREAGRRFFACGGDGARRGGALLSTRQSVQPATQSRLPAGRSVARFTPCWQEAPPPVGATAESDAVRRTSCQSHFFADPREAARRRDKACILRHNRALRRRKPSLDARFAEKKHSPPEPPRPRRPPNLAKSAPPAPPHASQYGNSTDDPAAR